MIKQLDTRGFSLTEFLVAIVILSIGVLGLGGVTAYSVQKVTVAQLDSRRGAALQGAIERLRSMPVDSLSDGSETSGAFSVAWTITDNGTFATASIVTTGPGMSRGAQATGMPNISGAVADTFTYVLTD